LENVQIIVDIAYGEDGRGSRDGECRQGVAHRSLTLIMFGSIFIGKPFISYMSRAARPRRHTAE
jgi:hypothetical protein